MQDRRFLSETIATSVVETNDGLTGRLLLRDDFKKLFYDILEEITKSLSFLQENPNHLSYREGTVCTGALLNPDWDLFMDMEKAFILQFKDDVRQWPIPGTNLFLADLGGDLVIDCEDSEHPSTIDLLSIETKVELEQIFCGLRTMHD